MAARKKEDAAPKAPAKRTVAKRAAAKKAPAKKARATKAPAKKARATKAPATKAPARKPARAKKGASPAPGRVALPDGGGPDGGGAGNGGNGGNGGAPAGLRVRMYRVGFGDCFLVTVPTASGAEHVLIDCGVFKGTSGEGDIGTIDDAVADLVQATGGKLALVVMTHRHADHIIGFSRCKAQFQKMKVGAVWMPVWETEYDGKTQKFQAELTALASRMHASLAASPARADDADRQQTMRLLLNATGPLGVAGGGTNAASLDLLKRGFGVKPAYYAGGDVPALPDGLARAGLTAQILGPPPLADLDLMKLMDLKKGVGQYLDAPAAGEGEEGEEGGGAGGDDEDGQGAGRFAPFAPVWSRGGNRLSPEAFREWGGDDGAVERMQKVVRDAQPASLLEAAKTLDSFLNNQSLVILFTFRGKKLLFAGDAQAGNWEHWLYATDTGDKAGAKPVGATAAEILGHLDFYKVGHHGSTNATPKAAVEALHKGVVAMCSTQEGVYGNPKAGTEVPRAPLLAALEERCSLVRSDQLEARAGKKVVAPSKGVPSSLPDPAEGSFERGPFWIEYSF
jgi:beta-lactamase superfamily II metal-dependent hydrolase